MAPFLSLFTVSETMAETKKRSNTFATPDFAYPETVERNARTAFDKASASGDNIDMMRAAIQLTLAKSMVDKSTSKANIAWLDSLANASAAPWGSLYYILEAKYYNELYSDNSYVYRQRVLPLDSYPENTGDWSQGLYCQKVTELLSRADSLLGDAAARPLREIAPLLDNVKNAEALGFTVGDFVTFQMIDLLSTYTRESSDWVIPFGGASETKLTPEGKARAFRDELVDWLIENGDSTGNGAVASLGVRLKAEAMNDVDRPGFLYSEIRKRMKSEWTAPLFDALYNCGYGRFPEVSSLAADPSYDWEHPFRDYSGDTDTSHMPSVSDFYSLAKEYLSAYPKAWQINAVRNIEREFITEEAAIKSRDGFLPGSEITGRVAVANSPEIVLSLYKVPEGMQSDVTIDNVLRAGKRVDMQKLSFDGARPFMDSREFSFASPGAGRYMILASLRPLSAADAKEYRNNWARIINVSDIAILTSLDMGDSASNRVYVVSGTDMSPVQGAKVSFYKSRGNGQILEKTLTTNDEGYVDASSLNDSYLIKASFNGSSETASYYYYRHMADRRKDVQTKADIFTDLAVYKPGERMQFAAVVYRRNDKTFSLLGNKDIYCALYNANRQKVDSVKLITDADGRCEGSFTVPDNGLLGSYTVVVGDDESALYKNYGSRSVEVAEYKAPTFYVEFSDDDESFMPGDVVRLKGVVKTYSGMPLSGASVSFEVGWMRWGWWWRGSTAASYGGEVTADEAGTFVIELPTAPLKGTRYEQGCFSVTVDATSPAGETQKGKTTFSLGKGMQISPSIPSEIQVEEEWVVMNVPVKDILGKNVPTEVDYEIRDITANAPMIGGTFTSPELKLSALAIPSGRYRITFTAEGADTVSAETVIYRRDERKVPYPTPLWLPEKKVVAKSGKTVSIPVGSYYPGSMLLCEVMSENGFVSREWVKSDGGMTSVEVPAPDDNSKLWVRFSAMHDLDGKNSTVTVVPSSLERKLEAKVKSFRDKLRPGDRETWSFLFTVDSVAVADMPAIGVMYNQALDAIAPFSWSFNPRAALYWNNPCSSSMTVPNSLSWQKRLKGYSSYRVEYFGLPVWNMYGQSFNSWFRGQRDGVFYVEAEEVVNEVRVTSAPMMARGAGEMKRAKMESVDYDGVAEGYNLEEEPVTAGADSGAGTSADKLEQPRPVEMPLAFFRPMLKADKDGVVSVEFEVPDFNTTWNFMLLGYTGELLSTTVSRSAVASKPVMAQANLPRFVRTGDKVEFAATLFNNSGAEMPIGGSMELFNPFTDEILASRAYGEEAMGNSQSRVITLEWEVPADMSAVGIRVYAFGEGCQDGEQTAIPVLPSSTPVVESTPFYMGASTPQKSVRLPEYPADANVTLKYCDNPVWECILALPSITKPNSVNIFSLLKSLYGNCISGGLMREYPQIKDALAALKGTSAGDSLLTSKLSKDQNLKTVELDNTPWVNNAQSDTERLRSLATLADTARTAEAIGSVMRRVIALQNSDGGWSWCPKMESSLFATSGVLLHFGMLRQMGYLPENARSLVAPAVRFCDDVIYKDYVKNKKYFSYVGMLDYLYTRSFFDVRPSTQFAPLMKTAIGKIAENWRDLGIYGKATAAILLKREGRDDVAREILASLTQFAKRDADLGWSFENLRSGYDGWPRLITTAQALEAFAEIEPDSEAVDGLRQWLVLQKTTEDWGADTYTAEVVQSILASGTRWTGSSALPEIKLGGKRIRLGEGLPLIGEYTVQLDARKVSGGRLEVRKGGDAPAWGGVISQYVKPIRDVEAARIPELQVSKALYRIEATGEGRTVSDLPLKVGDRVRVTITLNCGKDMDYVAVTDSRAACLEPVDQLSEYTAVDGMWMYREVRDESTNLFIPFLSKGEHVISYDCYVTREGTYASGIVTAQSQYAPLMTAHSAGAVLTITE